MIDKEPYGIKPSLDLVLIKIKEIGEKKGVLYLPKDIREGVMQTYQGEIIAIGPNVDQFKIGNIVLWGKYAGSIIKYDKKRYILMSESDINAILSSYLDIER